MKKTTYKLLNIETGTEFPLSLSGKNISNIIFSPDGKRIKVQYQENNTTTYKFFDLETGKEFSLFFLGKNVFRIYFSPDGKNLLVEYTEDVKEV